MQIVPSIFLTAGQGSLSLLERPLLLRKLDNLLLDEETLALSDAVDVRLCHVGSLGERSQVLELLD